jgi:nitrate/nitrite-specific signal transduction histidine kinase
MTSLLGVPIRVRNDVVGDLYLADKVGAPEFSEEDQHLIELLAAHAGIAVENARLYAQVRELTQLHERERIARDLHDGIIQDIYAGTLQLEDLAEDLPDEAMRERLLGVADHFSGVIRDVRTYIAGLRARELEGRLLSEGLVALVQEVSERGDLRATATVDGVPTACPMRRPTHCCRSRAKRSPMWSSTPRRPRPRCDWPTAQRVWRSRWPTTAAGLTRRQRWARSIAGSATCVPERRRRGAR